MNRIIIATLFTFLLALPVHAQEESSPVFIVGAHKCDWSRLQDLVAQDRERVLPIMQALVDEGTMIQAGQAMHHWGDEYNLLTWLAAPDMPSALAAWEDMTARYNEAHPDDRTFIETCPEHRDYFFTHAAGTQAAPPPVTEDNTPTLAVSYYQCDYTKLDDLVDAVHTRGLPISQALVDEGVLGSEALYTHAWGDEWNFVITRTANDLPTLLSALETYGERYEAAHGEPSRRLFEEHCTAHKDNIYTMTMATEQPAQ